jgi:hypothetical protein
MAHQQKRFFTRHAKSSAALCSLAVHAVLLIAAISFVVVRVARKEDLVFESKPITRPKMTLKKLQVPVNVKRRPPPKLRRRIVVKPRINQAMPEIRMPEISGVKGGVGNSTGVGLGGAGGIGFSMPEIKLFGVKSRGEKVLIILDASAGMMYDQMGGIAAYTIIKSELVRIVGSIGTATLFNIIVVDGGRSQMLFPQMVPASKANVEKLEEWIAPLNAVSKGMGDRDYGLQTLGPGGEGTGSNLQAGKITRQRSWLHPALVAQKLQADTIFLLTNNWGAQSKMVQSSAEQRSAWHQTADGKKWEESYRKAQQLLKEENRVRREKGEPPRVLSGRADIIHAYFPGLKGPPGDQIYRYTPQDIAEAFELIREKYAQQSKREKADSLGQRLRDRKKDEFSFNVVHFLRTDSSGGGGSSEKFRMLTRLCDGDYNTVEGLEAIQSYVSAQ